MNSIKNKQQGKKIFVLWSSFEIKKAISYFETAFFNKICSSVYFSRRDFFEISEHYARRNLLIRNSMKSGI
jgi:hypothetical protein